MLSEIKLRLPSARTLALPRTHFGKNVNDSAWVAAIDSGLIAPAGNFERVAAQLMQRACQDLRLIVKMLSCRRQRHTVRGAGEQVCADPVLQRANPPAEGRLGDVAWLGRPGKIQGFRERQIVLEPDQFHW